MVRTRLLLSIVCRSHCLREDYRIGPPPCRKVWQSNSVVFPCLPLIPSQTQLLRGICY